MASTCAVPVVTPAARRVPVAMLTDRRCHRINVRAMMKEEKAAASMAAVATAALAVPQVAEAAGPGISPSLKNFLLSIGAGGVVLLVILGAVVGVSNFDPVKRNK